MPDDQLTLLRRASARIPVPPPAIDGIARRRARRHRNRRLGSFTVAAVTFAAVLFVLVTALPHGASRSEPAGRRLPSPAGIAPAGIGSIESIRAFSADRAVALADHALIATSDGGAHWEAITPPGFGEMAASRMFFLDAEHGWVVSVPKGTFTSLTVFRTTDGGRSWERTEIPVPSPLDRLDTGPGFDAPTIGFSDLLYGWMALSNTAPQPLFVTSDGGATWRSGPSLDGGPGAQQFKSLLFTSSTEGWAVGERDDPLSPTTDKEIDSLLRTTDGGATWEHVDLPDPPLPGATAESASELGIPRFFGAPDAVAPAWAYQDGQRALFAYVTHDGGTTWSATAPIPIEQGRGSPIFLPSFASGASWVVTSTSGQIARTTDGGATWSVVHPSDFGEYGPSAIEFSSATEGWAMTCEVWSGSMDGDGQCNGPSISDRTGRYALYRTADGGATWTLVLTNEPTEG
jgi:photosystem II stability/assembly factor-like uncharacterized protein